MAADILVLCLCLVYQFLFFTQFLQNRRAFAGFFGRCGHRCGVNAFAGRWFAGRSFCRCRFRGRSLFACGCVLCSLGRNRGLWSRLFLTGFCRGRLFRGSLCRCGFDGCRLLFCRCACGRFLWSSLCRRGWLLWGFFRSFFWSLFCWHSLFLLCRFCRLLGWNSFLFRCLRCLLLCNRLGRQNLPDVASDSSKQFHVRFDAIHRSQQALVCCL